MLQGDKVLRSCILTPGTMHHPLPQIKRADQAERIVWPVLHEFRTHPIPYLIRSNKAGPCLTPFTTSTSPPFTMTLSLLRPDTRLSFKPFLSNYSIYRNMKLTCKNVSLRLLKCLSPFSLGSFTPLFPSFKFNPYSFFLSSSHIHARYEKLAVVVKAALDIYVPR